MTSQPVDIDDAGRTGAPSRTSADLRQWLDAIDELGQVRRLEGVHWDVEIGTVSELNYRSPDPAALIFDKIIGYPAGFRVLTGSVSNARRLGLTLSLGDDLDDEGLVASLRGRPSAWQEGARNFPPHQVDTAPVFQNGGSGKDVDLLKFPVPRWHEADGGRYLGTGGVTVTVDHGTGVSNVGAYRAQVQDDGATVTLNMVSGKHGAQHVQGWFRA
ncbi:MAG TPA: UbiD family decarboxylase, partial [Acidimicrobiales bacterium]|nr:UbiD family decarboxylase [Acidimicrobiales bacterium]